MFEFVRRFRKWVMIGGVILCAFAFGITGVVISVLSPGRTNANQTEGTFTVTTSEGATKEVQINRREFSQFQRRWQQFLIDRLNVTRRLFGSMAQRPQMYNRMVRMAIMQSARRDRFLGFLMMAQRRMQVPFFRNVVFLRYEGTGRSRERVSLLPAAEQTSAGGKDQIKQQVQKMRRWEKETTWRLLYFYRLARQWGISGTDREVQDLVSSYLDRMQNTKRGGTLSYSQLVEQQGGMTISNFEKTCKEYITLLKFFALVSRTTAPEPEALTSSFNKDNGYGKLLYTSLFHDAFRHEVLSDRTYQIRQDRLTYSIQKEEVDELSSFLSEAGGGSSRIGRNNQSSRSLAEQLEKRKFAYLYVPIERYKDEVDKPTTEEMKSHYEQNKEKYLKEGTSNSKSTNQGDGNAEEKTKEYIPFEQVKSKIRDDLYSDRLIRRAEQDLQKVKDETITDLETLGKPVDFKRITKKDPEGVSLTYKTSPLLDREDLSYWLKEIKQVPSSQADGLLSFVFDSTIKQNKGHGSYADEIYWFQNGVFLPRLIRIEGDQLTPSALTSSISYDVPAARELVLSDFKDEYPIWSLELKSLIRWRRLENETTNRVQEARQQFVDGYTTKRDQYGSNNQFEGPPAPSWFCHGKEESKDTPAEGEPVYGPGSYFSTNLFEKQITYQRDRHRLAKTAFQKQANQSNYPVRETDLFSLSDGPSGEGLLNQITSQLQGGRRRRGLMGTNQQSGATLYDPLSADGDQKSQIAALTVKLPKKVKELEQHIQKQRKRTISSARRSYLKTNVVVFVNQANLSLNKADSSTGTEKGKSQKTKPDSENKGPQE